MTEKKDGPENYTLEQLLERFDYIRLQLIKNQASMIVAMQKIALEPGDENPQLHRLAAELGSNHLDNKPLSKVLNQFPDVGKKPLVDIFGKNITVVTGFLALQAGGEQIISKPKKERRSHHKIIAHREFTEVQEMENRDLFLEKHPQVRDLLVNFKLERAGKKNLYYPLRQLHEEIVESFIVDKDGNKPQEKTIRTLVNNQLFKFFQAHPGAKEEWTEGNVRQKMISQPNVLELFKQLGHLEENSVTKLRLVNATDLPQPEVKKNGN